jgi:hypothetical protein
MKTKKAGNQQKYQNEHDTDEANLKKQEKMEKLFGDALHSPV